jgi:AmmeMemoRadiSam system protein A
MSSTEPRGIDDAVERRLLLTLAADSIEHGLAHGHPLRPDLSAYPSSFRVERATFVTLEIAAALRGCIGVLRATRPLVVDVAQNAFSAAFEDPRFPPLTQAEFPRLDIHISVLTPSERIEVCSEADLLAQLRPGVDGLILEDRGHRGTFLPAVWEQIPEPADFLAHLRRKAGLPSGYWSDQLRISRYRTESFSATLAQLRDAPTPPIG